MESKDVPQWVAQSFLRAMVNAGASATREEIISCCNELISQWRAPGRSEHGFQHLLDMLSRVDTLAPETPNADLVRLATWFHGIVFSTADLDVYTRNGGEDERASALMAEAKLSELGLPTEKIKTVKKLIIGLKKRGTERCDSASVTAEPAKTDAFHCCEFSPGSPTAAGTVVLAETGGFESIDMDQHALCDAHLGSLAVEPQRYRKYALRIREEYAHIPLTHFLAARIRIVQRLLSRKKLYISPLATTWESGARQNLSAELDWLTAELAEARESENFTQQMTRETIHSVPATSKDNSAEEGEEKIDPAATSALPSTAANETELSAAVAAGAGAAAEIFANPDLETQSFANTPAKIADQISEAEEKRTSQTTADYELVTTVGGDTVIRKATRAPLSSLEIIDDVFEPKRLAKIVQVPSKDRAKISISAATPAEIEAEIKHGMEAAPDY